MGAFDKFVSKEVKERSNKIKINPYELTEVSASTVAKICALKKNEGGGMETLELDKFFSSGFFGFLYNNRKEFFNIDFESEFTKRLDEIDMELSSHENSTATQVVVAGGFSAGKSSFLNTISGETDLLPTGIDPVSMVSTYVYFSKDTRDLIVSGINQSQRAILLDKDVLQSIKHADDQRKQGNAITLAAVLDKLMVELPAKSTDLDGLCFIDTPGYNNSNKANQENGKSDIDMASSSFKDGNVLFWIVDAEAGTVNQKDEEMIQKFYDEHVKDGGSAKIVIVFNKADKKRTDIANIANSAYTAMSRKSFAKDIIDIIGFSCVDKGILYSVSGYTTMGQLLAKVKASGNGYSTVNRLRDELYKMFEQEIQNQKETVEFWKTQQEEENKIRTDNRSFITNEEQDAKDLMDYLEDALLNNYNKMDKDYDMALECANTLKDGWSQFYDDVERWDITDHDCFTNTLTPILSRGANSFNSAYNKLINYNFSGGYKKEARIDLIKQIQNKFSSLQEQYNLYIERNDNSIKSYRDSIEEASKLRAQFESFGYQFKKALDSDIKCNIERKDRVSLPDVSYSIPSNLDVFVAIKNDDLLNFQLCFATKDGVNLTTCNAEGYSPFTFAVKQGNMEMIRFFMSHKADASALDNRGKNAFHTAAENHYGAICQLLLKEDSSLRGTMTREGKTADQLAASTPFVI